MKLKLSLLLLCLSSIAFAQRDSPDQIDTNKGKLTVHPVLHGTVALEWNGKTIYVDPYGGAEKFEGLPAADIVLITDIHGDHLNMETLNALDLQNATLVVPKAVMDQLPEAMKAKAKVLNNGDTKSFSGIKIKAIPMYNLPEDETSRHTKGRGNGYILTMGGKNVYFSGDTEDIPEMRQLKNIDIAFVCMNLPYTMDIDQASSAVLEFKPAIVYPYHYRGSGGLADVVGFKELVNEANSKIQVRLKNWYMN